MYVAVICLVSRGSGQTCTIGKDDDSEGNDRTDRRFYLDVNNPATCNGTITNWTVCYYGRIDSAFSYWATYAVYQTVGEESFERVSETFRAVRAVTSDGDGADGRNQLGFNCYTDTIDVGDSPLTIYAGDIIGACVFDPPDAELINRQQLNVVGDVSGESLLRVNVGDQDDEADCTMDIIPSNIPSSILQEQNNRRLHIYANIEPGKKTTTA